MSTLENTMLTAMQTVCFNDFHSDTTRLVKKHPMSDFLLNTLFLKKKATA